MATYFTGATLDDGLWRLSIPDNRANRQRFLHYFSTQLLEETIEEIQRRYHPEPVKKPVLTQEVVIKNVEDQAPGLGQLLYEAAEQEAAHQREEEFLAQEWAAAAETARQQEALAAETDAQRRLEQYQAAQEQVKQQAAILKLLQDQALALNPDRPSGSGVDPATARQGLSTVPPTPFAVLALAPGEADKPNLVPTRFPGKQPVPPGLVPPPLLRTQPPAQHGPPPSTQGDAVLFSLPAGGTRWPTNWPIPWTQYRRY